MPLGSATPHILTLLIEFFPEQDVLPYLIERYFVDFSKQKESFLAAPWSIRSSVYFTCSKLFWLRPAEMTDILKKSLTVWCNEERDDMGLRQVGRQVAMSMTTLSLDTAKTFFNDPAFSKLS